MESFPVYVDKEITHTGFQSTLLSTKEGIVVRKILLIANVVCQHSQISFNESEIFAFSLLTLAYQLQECPDRL